MDERLVFEKIENSLSIDDLFNLSKELYCNYNTLDTNNSINEIFNRIIPKYTQIIINNNFNTRKLFNYLINKYYHNEITIKSHFINNILLKSKNHITIFELNSGKSRLDLCKVNGTSIAFEIKTDLDTLYRLDKQLYDYMSLFEKVYVICSEKKCTLIEKNIPNECGIYSYKVTKNGKYIFKEYKKAKRSKIINEKQQLKLLTKKELEKIVEKKLLTKDELIDYVLKTKTKNQINLIFKNYLKAKYKNQWNFLESMQNNIYEIDYQWFFKNNLDPKIIYK